MKGLPALARDIKDVALDLAMAVLEGQYTKATDYAEEIVDALEAPCSCSTCKQLISVPAPFTVTTPLEWGTGSPPYAGQPLISDEVVIGLIFGTTDNTNSFTSTTATTGSAHTHWSPGGPPWGVSK